MSSWTQAFQTAELFGQSLRNSYMQMDINTLRAQVRELLNEVDRNIDDYNVLVRKHNGLLKEISQLKIEKSVLESRLAQAESLSQTMSGAVSRMQDPKMGLDRWAEEMMLTWRSRLVKIVGGGVPAAEMPLEQRREVNLRLYAISMVFYEGFIEVFEKLDHAAADPKPTRKERDKDIEEAMQWVLPQMPATGKVPSVQPFDVRCERAYQELKEALANRVIAYKKGSSELVVPIPAPENRVTFTFFYNFGFPRERQI